MTLPSIDNPSPVSGGEEISLERHMMRGSLWTIALRWCARLTGLISTVILARLLTPADYGLVAIASLIIGPIAIFTQTGQGAALIQHANPTRDHYDSAWTVSVLIGVGAGLAVLALAPITTAYFEEPRAGLIADVLGLRLMLYGLQNIGVVNFQRHLRFQRSFWFNVIPPFVSFVVTIVAAYIFRNYWALVIGIMVEQLTTLVLSYVMDPFRPRFCLSKVREIWSFSIWSLALNVGWYLSGMMDRIAIGSFAGAAGMGRYYVASDIAAAPTQEILQPMFSVLFPVMARAQHDAAKRRQLYLNVLYSAALVCTSTAVGTALVADDLVDLVLGPQWADIKPLIPLFALSWAVAGASGSVFTSFLAIGQPRKAVQLLAFRLLAMALLMFPVAYYFRNLEAVAATRLILALLIAPTLFAVLMKPLDLTIRDFTVTLWRPVTAGLAMTSVVLGINAAFTFNGLLRLIVDIGVGAAIYGAAIFLMWVAIGRPEGPEQLLWKIARKWVTTTSNTFSRAMCCF
jgi:lipopolysaccharide exporter